MTNDRLIPDFTHVYLRLSSYFAQLQVCVPIILILMIICCRWTVVTEMSASRSAAGVTVFDGRIFVSGGHDGLQIFNTVS